MAGGDLRSALVRDITANGAGANRCLSWYARGRRVLVGVARGLVFMHSQGVRIFASPDIAGRGREAVAWGGMLERREFKQLVLLYTIARQRCLLFLPDPLLLFS